MGHTKQHAKHLTHVKHLTQHAGDTRHAQRTPDRVGLGFMDRMQSESDGAQADLDKTSTDLGFDRSSTKKKAVSTLPNEYKQL